MGLETKQHQETTLSAVINVIHLWIFKEEKHQKGVCVLYMTHSLFSFFCLRVYIQVGCITNPNAFQTLFAAAVEEGEPV